MLRISLLSGDLNTVQLSSSGALLSGAASVRLFQLVASVLTLLFTASSIVSADLAAVNLLYSRYAPLFIPHASLAEALKTVGDALSVPESASLVSLPWAVCNRPGRALRRQTQAAGSCKRSGTQPRLSLKCF